MVTATEIALIRGLSVAFSGKKAKLKPLPTWAEVSGENKGKTAETRSDFAERVERANTKRQEAQTAELDAT
jgi:hypothetical protein